MLKKLSPLLLLCSLELFAGTLRIAPEANDDSASVIVGIKPSISVNLSANDRYGSIVNLDGSTVGRYGYLQFSGTTATYILYDNSSNAALAAGQVVTDIFNYTYANDVGQSASARLIVQVTGNQQIPVAIEDNASVVVGIKPSVSVNLSANDRYGSIVTLDDSTAGRYGYLQLAGTTATYTLYDNSSNAALAASQVVTDIFNYTYANDVGQSASARLIVQVTGNQQIPVAIDDYASVMPNKIDSVTGNVRTNDKNGASVYLNSSPASDYGFLILNPDGSFTYTVYKNAPSINKLKAGEVVADSFSYTIVDQYGQSATAKLNVKIIGNPVDATGNTVFPQPAGTPYDNVDIEPNDRSAKATPLNSGRNIQGSLYHGEDKDWYMLQSAGNEYITIDVCPAGSTCFGKKSWVAYVFDGGELTTAMEEKNFPLHHWLDETGTTCDLGDTSKSPTVYNCLGTLTPSLSWDPSPSTTYAVSNHLYLAYKAGYFSGALIGVVDPCFDTSSSLNVGLGSGARKYYIAVSSTLQGSDGKGQPVDECGVVSTVLREAGNSINGYDGTGTLAVPAVPAGPGGVPAAVAEQAAVPSKLKKFTTTHEYYSHFPNSDDQYTIKITGTGINPLLSATAAAGSATFNALTGELYIPKVRISDGLYEASLILQNSLAGTNPLTASVNSNGALKFALSDINGLGPGAISDAFQAMYDPVKQQVIIPRVTDIVNGNAFNAPPNAYSVIMQYHPEVVGSAQWLEVINSALIQ